jgi:hypothetical protein
VISRRGIIGPRNKETSEAFLLHKEALMKHPKERNEFGLDTDNALDVQKEAAKSMVPWVLGAVAFLVIVGLMMFGLPYNTNNTANTSPPTTTGAATPPLER